MLPKLLQMSMSDEEADVVTLSSRVNSSSSSSSSSLPSSSYS